MQETGYRITCSDNGYTRDPYYGLIVRRILRHLWASNRLECVLSAVGDPPFLLVQIVSADGADRALYSQGIKDDTEAKTVAADLWRTFVKDPH